MTRIGLVVMLVDVLDALVLCGVKVLLFGRLAILVFGEVAALTLVVLVLATTRRDGRLTMCDDAGVKGSG